MVQKPQEEHMNGQLIYERLYERVIVFGPRLLLGIIFLFVGFWITRLLLKWMRGSMHRKDVDANAKPFLLSFAGVTLRVLVVLGTMQILGMKMTLFTTIVGAFGVAAGLALSGTLQNFASGIVILLLKPFVVGDNILTQGLEGTVSSIQIFYTIITTFDNRTVIVPNSKLSNEVIINITAQGKRRLDLELSFPADMDFNQVRSLIQSAIADTGLSLPGTEPRVGISSIDGGTYKASISVWVNAHGFQDTRMLLLERLLAAIRTAHKTQ